MNFAASEDDVKICKKCLSGDKSAWDTLVHRYSKLVYSTIWGTLKKFPNPRSPDVNDVYQDVFAKIIEKLNQWRGEASLATWISVIARRTTIDHLRKQKHSPESPQNKDGPQNEGSSREEQGIDPEDKIFLRKLLTKLNSTELLVIKLIFYEGWSPEEIAELLHKKPGAIYTIKSRALEKLRKIGVKIGR
jgi:RNA polymerase sigma-70 factor (ECF subfamily)